MFEALAVALGGALGSLGRWQLGVLFKQWIPNLPVGTFAANVVAGAQNALFVLVCVACIPLVTMGIVLFVLPKMTK